jgi:uncharacterized protein
MAAQNIINSIEFARKALEIHGTIPVSQFPRLQDAYASADGALNWRLLGNVNDGKPTLQLKVSGGLGLTCQRCLEAMSYNIDISTLYYLVPDEDAIPSEEEDLDDRDYLVAETHMQVSELIEDEVLLAMPLAPKHEQEDCAVKGSRLELGKPNPFAVLQGLKSGKHRD